MMRMKVVVDGHEFSAQEREDELGTFDVDWLTAPNPPYGFFFHHPGATEAEVETLARNFLSQINWDTGVID
jgi:hypothetical protein